MHIHGSGGFYGNAMAIVPWHVDMNMCAPYLQSLKGLDLCSTIAAFVYFSSCYLMNELSVRMSMGFPV